MRIRPKLNPIAWIAIIPLIAELVAHVVDALRDGKIDDAEVREIGGQLVQIVASVVATPSS